MNERKDTYFVAVKALILKQNKLLITHDIFGSWDIPGGRIKPDEFTVPLESIMDRKIREELGNSFKHRLGKVALHFRHERVEHHTGEAARIFAVGYEAQYISGEVELGENHDEHIWVDLNDFKPEDFFEGGWLRGIKEYMSLGKTQ